jgi:magnesium transporter
MTPQKAPASVQYFAAHGGTVEAVSAEHAVEFIGACGRTPAEIPEHDFVWIDVANPGEEEADLLRERLHLHPLAVEDALRGRQRPKMDRYPEYLFVVFYAVRMNPERGRIALEEIHLFVANNFLITVHDQDLPQVHEVVTAWMARPSRMQGPGAAAHALLDAIVDDYFPVVEKLADQLDALEDRILEGRSRSELHPAIELRHQLIMIRRVLSPERELVSTLLRHDLPSLRPELIPYFQDVYDHLLRITEEIDTIRDLLTGLIEVHASNSANRLNQTMQTLTAWSIILMSVAVVAGIYGMNFEVMPELGLAWGYYGTLVLMLVIGLSLIVYFRRRRWL